MSNCLLLLAPTPNLPQPKRAGLLSLVRQVVLAQLFLTSTCVRHKFVDNTCILDEHRGGASLEQDNIDVAKHHMFCDRFGLDVYFTRHARERMFQRSINEDEICELLESGETRYKDNKRLWIAKNMKNRNDNLICVAVALEDRLIVKTVMHRFQWEVEE